MIARIIIGSGNNRHVSALPLESARRDNAGKGMTQFLNIEQPQQRRRRRA